MVEGVPEPKVVCLGATYKPNVRDTRESPGARGRRRPAVSRQRILVVAGTRPEAIKMAPVILRLRREPERFETVVCATAQHREMLDSVFDLFAIEPEVDLDLMRPDQSLNQVAAGVFDRLDRVLVETAPEWVLAAAHFAPTPLPPSGKECCLRL